MIVTGAMFLLTFLFGLCLSKTSKDNAKKTLFQTIVEYYTGKSKDVASDFKNMASGIEFHAEGIMDKEYNIKNDYVTVGAAVTKDVSTQFKMEKVGQTLKLMVSHKQNQVIDGVNFAQVMSSEEYILKNDWFVAKDGKFRHYYAVVDSIVGEEKLSEPKIIELVGNEKSKAEPFVGITLLNVVDVSEMDEDNLNFISKSTSIYKFKGKRKYAYKATEWSAFCTSF